LGGTGSGCTADITVVDGEVSSIQLVNGGDNYIAGSRLTTSNTNLGGTGDGFFITILSVNSLGRIVGVFCQGTAPLLSSGETFTGIAGTNVESGTGASFAVKRVNIGYFVSVANSGTGYTVGDILVISGSELGGVDITNDCVLTVTRAGTVGNILQISIQGTAAAGVELYFNQTAVKQYGSGAEFDFVVASGERTVFDGTSLRFTAPVDNYTVSDEFDKYIVFPKRTILT
jgi:hypothetical protein